MVAAVELDQGRRRVLVKHHPNAVLHADLTRLRASDLPESEVWFVTLPCQSFSIAGHKGKAGAKSRKGLADPEKGGLWTHILRLIQERRRRGTAPRLVLFENVRGMLSSNKGADWREIRRSAGANGLVELAGDVLIASWFGVPQDRERLFLVWRVAPTQAE